MNFIPKTIKEDDIYRERYSLACERIAEIAQEACSESSGIPEVFQEYFQRTAQFVLLCDEAYRLCADGTLYSMTLAALQKQNRALYFDILPEQYAHSYANPDYASECLGNTYGPLLCVLYTELRGMISYAFQQRLFYLTTAMELFIEIYNLFEDGTSPDEIRDAIYYYVFDYADITIEDRTLFMLDPSRDFFINLITQCDFRDLHYLYYFGEYVSENELMTAEYLNSLPAEEIEALAKTYTQGFMKGFELYRIDLSRKSTVNIRYSLGFERIIRAAVTQFREHNLNTTIYPAAVSLIHRGRLRIGLISTSPNKQYDYDHRMDDALLLDKALLERKLAQQRHAYEKHRELASAYAGPAVMEVFGELPFTPEAKKTVPQYSEKQQQLKREYQAAYTAMSNEFIPGEETSFTIIAYPVPEIGPDYRNIFNETIRVNTLDSSQYQEIQTRLIQALDQGSSVTITGRNGNRTNLTVALPPLEHPETQTNFENCLADVNIPLGEVFTSPQLEGTHGILHVTQVYLNELKYKDLTLEFKDGMITAYDCSNFPQKEENAKYIAQNLLNNHPSLPMGEFAIGTNTTAYRMGEKYNISHLLPILIAEKTGPHFAVGDTCFSHEEDMATFNPDGKQMMAKDNSCSRLRRTDPQKAYFSCHTDITIPYHELRDIIVHCRDGREIPLIQEGRFVLPGTEALNEVLEE